MSLGASEWSKNPITQIETTWIKREQRSGSWWRRPMWALLACSLGITLASIDYVSNDKLVADSRQMWWLRNAALVFTVVITLAHFLVLLRALHIATNGLTTRSRTTIWDTLVLTGIDTRRLILGKWRVTLQHTWRDFLMLAGLRVGVVLGLGVIVFNSTGNPPFAYMESGQAVRPMLDMLLAAALIIAFTMFNWVFTAAAGVAGSLLTRPRRSGTLTAFSARSLAIMLPVLVILLPTIMYLLIEGPLIIGEDNVLVLLSRSLVLLILNAVDNGTISLAMLANPLDRETTILITSVLLTLLLYGLLTVMLLRIAQYIARRQGINA